MKQPTEQRVMCRLFFNVDYPKPLSQRDLDWCADNLSVVACEMLKGEHKDGYTLFLLEPPATFKRSISYED